MTAPSSDQPPRLLLRAADAEDLRVIAACLQDAILPLSDACFLAEERRFVLVVNRFRWEIESDETIEPETGLHERVLCGVRFEGVKRVASRGIDRRHQTLPLEILTVMVEEGLGPGEYALQVVFAGGGAIRLEVDRILCHLEDLDEAWPTPWRPHHPVETE
jgi:hypothetical protein